MSRWIRWLATLVRFGAFYLGEVLVSNLRVAGDVLAPRPRLSPGIVAVPVAGLTERQVLVLAALLTMTPGTLSLEAEPEAGRLYLHCLYTRPSVDALRQIIEERYVHAVRILV